MRIPLITILLLAAASFGRLEADLNRDGIVDLQDMAILAAEWLEGETGDVLGEEYVADGTFEAGTPWRLDEYGNTAIVDGALRLGIDVGDSYGEQEIDIVAGDPYWLTFQVSSYYNPGGLDISVSLGGTRLAIVADGAYEVPLIAGAADRLIRFAAQAGTPRAAWISRVSVRQIVPSVSVPPLPQKGR